MTPKGYANAAVPSALLLSPPFVRCGLRLSSPCIAQLEKKEDEDEDDEDQEDEDDDDDDDDDGDDHAD